MKYLTFSYDDGVTQDIRLIGLLNRYGMKATFNLNSMLLGKQGVLEREGVRVRHDKISPADVRAVYDGHEVAAHTLTHPLLTQLPDSEIIRQVETDRQKLSALCGDTVVGMAYPGGGQNYDRRTAEVIRNNTSIEYARTIEQNHSFAVQQDLLTFRPTVDSYHEMDLLFSLGQKFLDCSAQTPMIFFVWGHAFEFDIRDDWGRFEEFLQMMSGRPDICYCTNREALLGTRV